MPGPGSLAPIRRPIPYLYTEHEIAALSQAAGELGPRNSLRPYTYATVIGLLASTGVRIGEALRLQVSDVRLDTPLPHLHIGEGKFRKSRLVPLHPTTVAKLTTYTHERERLHYAAFSDAFFVTESGRPLAYEACRETFATLLARAGIHPPARGGRPGMHGLRHTLYRGANGGVAAGGLAAQRSASHALCLSRPCSSLHTYWYMTATPELLTLAADAFQQYAGQGEHNG